MTRVHEHSEKYDVAKYRGVVVGPGQHECQHGDHFLRLKPPLVPPVNHHGHDDKDQGAELGPGARPELQQKNQGGQQDDHQQFGGTHHAAIKQKGRQRKQEEAQHNQVGTGIKAEHVREEVEQCLEQAPGCN